MKRHVTVLSGVLACWLVLAAVAADAPAVKRVKADPVPVQIRSGTMFLIPLTDGSSGVARCENIEGKARLTIIAGGAFVDFQILAWGGPGPVPPIPPTPIPPPVPPVPPVPVEPLWGALIVEESGTRTPQLAALLTDASVRKFFTDNSLAFRVCDPDETDANDKTPADLAPWIAKAKAGGLPRLFLLGKKGAEIYSGPVPADAAALLALVKLPPGKKGP
jgi:hypothetical protein